ncbi:hypothetical protein GLAREA_07789 [Glarea lozoyensis ATCC 20868]|uniref:Uncharacterized protein n=1 Tax=Glarea lozoyensis (strain ATCC 20868 / MF5171) TaxID=1116229 RepID=S3D4B1_GLAL2|nr:uncharacterized protein GLAREA_07789 [Glarea lozoyensis ATCC 20868]EPE32655.1 hypothetical protein GLAREA_07789 [Glarea lozoyensis ATCC 20868]
MYKRENRTFCVNRNVYPQAMQDIRKLSFPELDKIRCIRFVWTYFDSVGLTDKPFQNLVRGKKITMRNNLIKVVFVFAFNYPEPRYYIDTHNSQPQVDGMNRFEYPTIIQANIEFLSRASKEGIKTVESGIEGVNTLFEDRRREDILVWISCPPVAPTDRRFLKLPFMEDNVEVGRNSGLLLTWYTKKKSSIHDKERFVNGLRPRLIPGEDRPS